MHNALTFAQLSDPHMSSPLGARWQDLANKRLLGYLSWRKRRRAEHRGEVLAAMQRDLLQISPQHTVITGDLTHIALPEEFHQARDWLASLGSPQDITVVPGNHDAYIQVSWQQGLGCWQPWMVSDKAVAGGAADSVEAVFPSLRIRGPVAFIGLSSARPSAPFMATGGLGERQLEQLGVLLEQTGRQGLFRVLLLHHPPVPGEERWRKRLTDAARLCDVIARHGADLVLHGHRHRSVQSRIEIPGTHVPVFGIPSASYLGDKPGRIASYHVYRVQQAGEVWRLGISVRGFSADRGTFDQVQETSIELARHAG